MDLRKYPEPSDFSRCSYSAVVSDLHLCEEEKENTQYPLWKKYKTRQFFFDESFRAFLEYISQSANGESLELVLNGDIFDFDSVCDTPKTPTFRISWLEKRRGLHPEEQKSVFKMKRILDHHGIWVAALREFIQKGHRVIFIIGNHDAELHFPLVQRAVIEAFQLNEAEAQLVRFNEWFYISNSDTLIEHGHQYDPFCMIQDPINPFIQRSNRIEVRLPFGNLATRYMINGMGFFNPHVDTNFIMSAGEYVRFFFKYIVKAQPLLMFTWLWGATLVLVQSFFDRIRPSIRDPLTLEDRVDWIAKKANATPRMVRELKELFVPPASSYPLILAQELWLDRAFLVVVALLGLFEIFLLVNQWFAFSILWMIIPTTVFVPFFVFYSQSVTSLVIHHKEPKEKILNMASLITKTSRIVFGHTHHVRHEIIGPVEHLNSGTWSPAFQDVECTQPIDVKTFVWLYPHESGARKAKVMQFTEGTGREIFIPKAQQSKRPAA